MTEHSLVDLVDPKYLHEHQITYTRAWRMMAEIISGSSPSAVDPFLEEGRTAEEQQRRALRQRLKPLKEGLDGEGHTHVDPESGGLWFVCVKCDGAMEQDEMHSAGYCNFCYQMSKDD